MKFTNVDEVKEFLKAVDECKHDVHLRSVYGDDYNLKSQLSMYMGIVALLKDHGEELEVTCDSKADEPIILSWLNQHPEYL